MDNALRQDFLRWKRLAIKGIAFDSAPQARLRIAEVVAEAPYARVVVESDRTLNIDHVLRLSDAPDSAPAPKAEPALDAASSVDIAIARVRVTGGSANLADLWIQPRFAVGILDLGGTIEGLSSTPGSRARVTLDGAVDRYAPVEIRGELNPFSAALFSDVSLRFRNLDLSAATPYSGRFAGYEIRKGKLSAEFGYRIEARRLDARHHLVVDQLELGDRVESPDATGLPVRLAIALLKDRNGVIDLQLPLTGSLDDPKFRIGPLIWKMIGNLVVKVATAPFALLGSLFGGGETVNQIAFAPGSAMLDDVAKQRLEAVRRGMVERPAIRLDVPAAFDAQVDRPAMLRRQLASQLAQVAPDAGPDRFRQLLAAWRAEAGEAPLPPAAAALAAPKRGRGKPPAQAPSAETSAEAIAQLEQSLLERYVVDDEELADLGRQRAAAIQDALLATQDIDPVRIFVTDGKPAAADAEQLRVDLILK